jgi:hypothetical protein
VKCLKGLKEGAKFGEPMVNPKLKVKADAKEVKADIKEVKGDVKPAPKAKAAPNPRVVNKPTKAEFNQISNNTTEQDNIDLINEYEPEEVMDDLEIDLDTYNLFKERKLDTEHDAKFLEYLKLYKTASHHHYITLTTYVESKNFTKIMKKLKECDLRKIDTYRLVECAISTGVFTGVILHCLIEHGIDINYHPKGKPSPMELDVDKLFTDLFKQQKKKNKK